MKKLFSIALLCCITLLASAADIPASLLALHKSGESISGNFTEVTSMPKLNKETKKTGKLTYTAPDDMRLDYTDPAGDYVLITKNAIESKQEGNVRKFSCKDEKMRMSVFRATLLAAMAGDIQKVADLNEAVIDAKESGSEYVIHLTPAKAAKHGISKLDLTYSKKTGRLQSLCFTKGNGNTTTYTMK